MSAFNWRNQPRTTTSPTNKHVVASPAPITFNGQALSTSQRTQRKRAAEAAARDATPTGRVGG